MVKAVLACAAALAVSGIAGFGSGTPVQSSGLSARAHDDLFGIFCSDCPNSAVLARINPLTLRPQPGRRLRIGNYAFQGFAPEGRRIALADVYGEGSIRLIALDKLRVTWTTKIGDRLAALAWLRCGRPVAVVGDHPPGDLQIKLLDPRHRRVARGGRIAGPVWVRDNVPSDRHLVLLLGRAASGMLPATEIAIIDSEGAVRRVVLSQVRTGYLEDGEVYRRSEPGLAVDPSGRRAVVVAAGAPVAEIELATGTVSYHELRRPISLVGRLRNWLEPAALAKEPVDGPIRHATWLANGLIAVTGEDHHVTRLQDGRVEERIIPAGVQLINPADWSVRMIDERAGSVSVGRNVVLAWTFPMIYVPAELRQIGLTAYALDGERRFQLFSGMPVMDLVVAGRYAYAQMGANIQVVDVAAGRVVRRLATYTRPQLLIRRP